MLGGIVPPRDVYTLLGRDAELERLRGLLGGVGADGLRVVLVEGPAGIGKTRLVSEIVAEYGEVASCLWARAPRWGSTVSFGMWVEALDRHLRARTAQELQRLCGASSGELGFLLESVERIAPPTERPPPQRERLLDALIEVTDRLARQRPMLLAFDDVHLADASSWEVLGYLARRLSRSPIGILATARPNELRDHPIAAEVVVGLVEDHLVHRLALEPLSPDAVARLAGEVITRYDGTAAEVPGQLVDWLLRRTLGHPLFVVRLLEALLDEDVDLSAPHLDRLPTSLRERVMVELDRLDPGDREILEILAVVGQRAGLTHLMELSDRPLEELGRPLERLCKARLVAEHETGRDLRYEVAHPIMQDAVYEAIGAARRRALHRSVARTLRSAGALGAAAAHYARSAERGDAEVVTALCEAIRQAEDRGLYQEALATLEALVDVLPAGDDLWLQVLDALDWQAEWVLGHLAEGDATVAVTAMSRIRPLAERSRDLVAQATVALHQAAFLSIGTGQLDEAEEACRRAIAGFAAVGDPEGTLLARNELAWIRACLGDLEEAAALSGEVATAAESSGQVRAAIHAYGSRGYALVRMGRWDTGEACLRRGIKLAGEVGDTYRMAWTRNHLGVLLSLNGQIDAGRSMIERVLDVDPSAPDTGSFEYLAHTDWLAGRLTDSVAWVQRSEVRRPMGNSRRRAWARAVAGRAYAEMAEHAKARRRIEQSRATYQDQPILEWAAWPEWAGAVLAWQNGDHSRALLTLGRVVERFAGMGAAAYEALPLVDQGEIAADAGEATTATNAAARLAEIADDVGGDLHPWLADLGDAWHRLASGDFTDIPVRMEKTAAALANAGYRLYAAIATEATGRALITVDRSRAIDVLEDAAARYDRCDARWRRDRALAVLSRLGSRGRRTAAGVRGPGSLTDRERQVAQLAAQGYTARETAEQLFISPRTVESHLGVVYAKLGVSSKRELIRHAREIGL